jgi:hypothetical protein
MTDEDDDKGTLPLTAATAYLYENLLPPSQVAQQELAGDGTVINPVPPAAQELAREHGIRREGE